MHPLVCPGCSARACGTAPWLSATQTGPLGLHGSVLLRCPPPYVSEPLRDSKRPLHTPGGSLLLNARMRTMCNLGVHPVSGPAMCVCLLHSGPIGQLTSCRLSCLTCCNRSCTAARVLMRSCCTAMRCYSHL